MPPKKISCVSRMELQDSPITPEHIRQGTPVARNRVLAVSTDKSAWTMQWDCTAGQFIWVYAFDETVHIVEGEAILTEADGTRHVLKTGDTAFFPKGVTLHWQVENYVRKVAVCQVPQPVALNVPLRLARRLMNRIAAWMKNWLAPQAVLPPRSSAGAAPQGQTLHISG